MALANLADLPSEVLLQIISYLEPVHITQLQLISRAFLHIGRDDTVWRAKCFECLPFIDAPGQRTPQSGHSHPEGRPTQPLRDGAGQAALSSLRALTDNIASTFGEPARDARQVAELRERDRVRIMANWDPSYPSERVSWYNEYVQRHGPVSVSWLQQPHTYGAKSLETEQVETRGVALYWPDGPREEDCGDGAVLAVSPLDDGGVCIWDINGTRGRKGAVIARSKPGILFIDGPGTDDNRRSRRVDSGVTESVSVDSGQRRAFFAVQSHLISVDLQNLTVTGCESFPWSITALSAAHATVPLTVGTNLGIHIYDYRARARCRGEALDTVDNISNLRLDAKYFYERNLKSLFDEDPLPLYAPLSQPGPLSIVHLQRSGSGADLSDDIYVAGRFSNILHYDRRRFPSIQDSIYSGGRLCSMTSLPYPFFPLDSEVRRRGELSLEQIRASKALPGGRTLVACGEYNTKGSLELYGLAGSTTSTSGTLEGHGTSVLKNRQTASSCKLLSVANHGTRIVVSDGLGYVKWFERDGFTEVRQCRVGHSDRTAPQPFSPMLASDEIARKLLPVGSGGGIDGRGGPGELLFWTGEKLGLVGFSSRPGLMAEEFEDRPEPGEEAGTEEAARVYRNQMREALERHADETRFVKNLGFGSDLV